MLQWQGRAQVSSGACAPPFLPPGTHGPAALRLAPPPPVPSSVTPPPPQGASLSGVIPVQGARTVEPGLACVVKVVVWAVILASSVANLTRQAAKSERGLPHA
eukprot:scaffold26720_cov124-Isochrysis_galbana.AAC.2